jgi:hypothetical protein
VSPGGLGSAAGDLEFNQIADRGESGALLTIRLSGPAPHARSGRRGGFAASRRRRQCWSAPSEIDNLDAVAAASADTFLSPQVSRQPYRGSLLQATVKRQPVEQHFCAPDDPVTAVARATWSVRVRPASAGYALHRDRHLQY